MRYFFAFLVVFALSGDAAAQAIGVSGHGGGICAEFAHAYKRNPFSAETNYFIWAQGFMSGLNTVFIAHKMPSRNLGARTIPQQQSHIRAYCDQHPLAEYVQAVLSLMETLPLVPPHSN